MSSCAARRLVGIADRRALGDADLRLDDVDAGDRSVTVCSTWMRGFTSMK